MYSDYIFFASSNINRTSVKVPLQQYVEYERLIKRMWFSKNDAAKRLLKMLFLKEDEVLKG